MMQGNFGKYLCQPLDIDDQQFNHGQVQMIHMRKGRTYYLQKMDILVCH